MRGSAVDALEFRRSLRRTPTWAETALWRALRTRQLGAKWRRQHSAGPYVLDLYCPAARLAVELDGDPHFTAERQMKDAERDRYLASRGIRVLRFTNEQLFTEGDAVLECIWAAVRDGGHSPRDAGAGSRGGTRGSHSPPSP